MMSKLNGFFSLRSPYDLLQKLEADFQRLRSADPVSVGAQYAAFDFFVTAEHLVDWQVEAIGGSKANHRAYPDGDLVSHVANGAKHFRVDDSRHTTARDSRAAGAFQADAFQGSAFQTTPILVIDLENGSIAVVLDVAQRVVDHWRKTIT